MSEHNHPNQQVGSQYNADAIHIHHHHAPQVGTNSGDDAAIPAGTPLTVSLARGAKMKLVYLPPGTFLMGSVVSEPGRQDGEGPQHRVTLTKGFYLASYPVTQTQWQTVMGTNPSSIYGDERPVDKVSWDDSQAFCDKLSHLAGKPFCLPTEAEWEYACRAGTTTPFNGGAGRETLEKVGWYSGNSGGQTHPVGRKAPNAWGLFDMHGNVREWCDDWYGAYTEYDTDDPFNPKDVGGRLLRGGNCVHGPDYCRAASRSSLKPDLRFNHNGVRVCLRLG